MHVSRMSALLMLAVVVLWAAVPALACLTPAQQDDCCRKMQIAGSCNMTVDQSCCQVHGRESSPPLTRAALSDPPLTLVSLAVGPVLPVSDASPAMPRQVVESISPASRSGTSVLRI